MKALRRPPGTPKAFQQQALFERPVFARARRICLALPETSETSSHGHPNFRAGKKTFCAFEMHQGRPSIAVRVPSDEFSEQIAAGLMFPTPYGRGAWTSLWVDSGHANEGATATPWNTKGVPAKNWVDKEVNWKELAALIQRACAAAVGRSGAREVGR